MADKFQRSMKWPGLDDTYYFLPLVSEDDNGKVMTVKDGEWATGDGQVSFDTFASGKTIILDDAADRPLRGLRVFGKTTQETTTGVNLFSSAWVQGMISSETGTQASNSTHICTADYISVTPNTVYTMTRTIATDYINVRAYDADKNFIGTGSATLTFVRGSGSSSNPMAARSYWVTFRVGNGVHYLKFNDRSNNLSTQYMMVLGEEVPITYEPYTGGAPSPSPDYPQPLNSVGDDGAVNVTVVGKNLFDPNRIVNLGIDATIVERDNCRGYYVPITASSYTVSRRNTTDFNRFRIGFTYVVPADGVRPYSVVDAVDDTAITYTVPENAKFLYVYLSNQSHAITGEMLQIEVGTVATEWGSPAQTLTLSTPNGLPGIPVDSGGNYTDADGQQWVCDEVDLERGVYVQRVEKHNSADLTLDEVFSVVVTNPNGYVWRLYHNAATANAMSSAHQVSAAFVSATLTKGQMRVAMNSSIANKINMIVVLDASTKEGALAELQRMEFDYIVAIPPLETPLSTEEIAAYKAAQTHCPITTIYNDESAEMHVRYANRNNIDEDSILFRAQILTEAQKAQARENIGAAGLTDVPDNVYTTDNLQFRGGLKFENGVVSIDPDALLGLLPDAEEVSY